MPLTSILKTIRLSNESASSKNNDSRLAFSRNDDSKPIFRRNNGNNVRFDGNSIEHAKKSRKLKA